MSSVNEILCIHSVIYNDLHSFKKEKYGRYNNPRKMRYNIKGDKKRRFKIYNLNKLEKRIRSRKGGHRKDMQNEE